MTSPLDTSPLDTASLDTASSDTSAVGGTASEPRRSRISFAAPPSHVDRLIVHQFDPSRPSPGGIDSCLRGICRYVPAHVDVAIVGVDTGHGPRARRLGRWEQHVTDDDRRIWFLPVARLDPADQVRRVPHSLRLVAGLYAQRAQLPTADVLQVHRMDTALVLRRLLPLPQSYFIHTQENGLVGRTSDSFWRFVGPVHRRLERTVVAWAKTVVVFNESYTDVVRRWNPRTVFSPTWFDPRLIGAGSPVRNPHQLLWVGRLQTPKDPALALQAYAELVAQDPGTPWRLDVVGPGGLWDELHQQLADLPPHVRSGVRLLGRVAPEDVAARMAAAGVFLMTSHPGYEGYARVLVESMASGLPAVVTAGSDTGGLVVDGETGYTGTRDPAELARRVRQAALLDRDAVRSAVASLDAPSLVRRLFGITGTGVGEAHPAGVDAERSSVGRSRAAVPARPGAGAR